MNIVLHEESFILAEKTLSAGIANSLTGDTLGAITINRMDNKARAIQEVANQLGWNEDISKLIERVNQLDKGLIQEDEFIYLLGWSGRCKLIHKLDQFQIPSESKNEYTIPDLLVEIETENGPAKFLIEIKTSIKNSLSWTEKYYNGLVNYSNLLQIPILIAWKWSGFSIWSLFDINNFSRPISNFKISFEKAHQENLLSKLIGDYVVMLYPEFGLNVSMKKVAKMSETKNEDGNINISWQTVIDEVYFSGKDNRKIDVSNKGAFALLLSMQTEEVLTETESHLLTKFIPHPNKMQFAQSIPINLIQAFSNEEINWLHSVRDKKYPFDYEDLLDEMKKALEQELVEHVFFVQPLSEK